MEEDEQEEILLMSECIKYFTERKQKRHCKEFVVLGAPKKEGSDNVFSALSVLL